MTNEQPARPTGELMQTLADAAGRLLRQELRQGQEELKGKAIDSVPGAAMLLGAAVIGAAAAGTGTVFFLRVVEKLLPRTIAAGVATAALGGGAAALAMAGYQEIQKVNLVPEQTLRSIRADVETATGNTTET